MQRFQVPSLSKTKVFIPKKLNKDSKLRNGRVKSSKNLIKSEVQGGNRLELHKNNSVWTTRLCDAAHAIAGDLKPGNEQACNRCVCSALDTPGKLHRKKMRKKRENQKHKAKTQTMTFCSSDLPKTHHFQRKNSKFTLL